MQQFRIRKPQLFDFRETLWFLDRNLDDCMHRVAGNKVYRLFPSGKKAALVSISEDKNDLVISVEKGKLAEPEFVTQFITEWFDLDRDIGPFYKLLKMDPDFNVLAKKYNGFRMVGIPDLFETLCWCVIGQQINLQFAYKVKNRVVESFGQSIKHEGMVYYVFPEPEVLREVKIEEYRAMQLTTRKAEYIKGISELFCDGTLSKEKLLKLGDEEMMRKKLMEVRGRGEWTANYAVMKSLRGMDCVPYGDSGVNMALLKFKGIPKKNNRALVDAVFDEFPGWRSYLVYYLGRSLREKVA